MTFLTENVSQSSATAAVEEGGQSQSQTTGQILSDQTTQTISMILLYGVAPAIGTVGVVFNIFSIIVLFKHGIHKCSNVLLISLAFTDISYLIGYNSVPYLLYSFQGGGKFLYSEPVSIFLSVMYFVFVLMDYGGGLTAMTIPMLITIERLVAVFMPLRFGQIITPRRTWTVVGCTAVFWVATMTYTCFWYKFEYVFDEQLNRSVGILSKSDLFHEDFDTIPIFQEMFFSLKIPPLLTVVGCSAIIAKVKMASRERSKMMTSSKNESTSKTTQTLLAVCAAYLFICAIVAVPGYLPKHLSAYSVTTDNPSNMAVVIYQVMNTMYSFNSSWNFLVYVGLNKNFRDTFKEIMTRRCCKKS